MLVIQQAEYGKKPVRFTWYIGMPLPNALVANPNSIEWMQADEHELDYLHRIYPVSKQIKPDSPVVKFHSQTSRVLFQAMIDAYGQKKEVETMAQDTRLVNVRYSCGHSLGLMDVPEARKYAEVAANSLCPECKAKELPKLSTISDGNKIVRWIDKRMALLDADMLVAVQSDNNAKQYAIGAKLSILRELKEAIQNV